MNDGRPDDRRRGDGLPRGLGETRIGSRAFRWGERTFVMGILNVAHGSLYAFGGYTAATFVAAVGGA